VNNGIDVEVAKVQKPAHLPHGTIEVKHRGLQLSIKIIARRQSSSLRLQTLLFCETSTAGAIPTIRRHMLQHQSRRMPCPLTVFGVIIFLNRNHNGGI